MDSEFLKKTSDCDIVTLAELHCDEELSLPGFVSLKQKIRKKLHKGPKIAGGIGIFVKEAYQHLVQVIPNDNQDSIWLKIKKEACDEPEDIFLGSFYISPERKKTSSPNFFTTLNKELNTYRQKGVILVQGDMNARTGIDSDFVDSDKSDELFGVQNLSNQSIRNSEDSTVNARGRELLDLCKVNDLLITNGRKIGDLFGKLTSHQYNGSALNDYLLAPNHFFPKISRFSVGSFSPWLSDHCPIYSTINVNKLTKDNIPQERPRDIQPRFLFDANSKQNFCNALKSAENSQRVRELLENENLSALNLGAAAKSLLLENAGKCQTKMTKSINAENSDAPWFDTECKKARNNLRKLGNELKRDPKNHETRTLLQNEKKIFKKMTVGKKRKHRQNVSDKLSQSHVSQREFWKILDKLSEKKANTSSFVSHHAMSRHFKSLLNSKRDIAIPPKCKERGPLDHVIILEELIKGSEVLKAGKAVGYDNICNEMLVCLVEVYPTMLLRLFNLILDSGDVLPEWVISFIVPIHKGGAKSDPSNYRGISLLSCLGKFFLSILNNRLAKFALDNGILSESQLGFIRGNRTSDAHIIIRNLIDKFCHKKNKKIYSCFIDLSKAFDTVPRDILLRKLQDVGIKGNVFNIIRSIYSNDCAYMKIDGKITTSFPINQGVRQGCVLSPLLFNIFMADLAKSLVSVDNGFQMDNSKINSIFWADDIVLLCEDGSQLDKMLKMIAQYCDANELTINCKKTKCIIFNKTGRLLREKFFLNGTALENVRQYKYLGFLFTPSGEILSGLKDLRDRAFKAFLAIKRKMGESFNQDVKTALNLYESMIKPILTYASDFWGCLKLPKNNPIEVFHMKVLKQILGVQKQTTNLGVLLELGKTTLDLECIKLGVKNWERIKKGNANTLLRASYKDANIEELPWISGIRLNLENNGLLSLFLNEYPDKPPFIGKKLHQILVDQFHQTAFENIRSEGSKLRTYALFKSEIGIEPYLSKIRNVATRTQVARFRLSNHKLAIEEGRHQKISADLRFCPFCKNKVECEIHFVTDCPTYTHLRANLYHEMDNEVPSFKYWPPKEKFTLILSNSDSEHVASYIHKCLELREFLIACPRRLD